MLGTAGFEVAHALFHGEPYAGHIHQIGAQAGLPVAGILTQFQELGAHIGGEFMAMPGKKGGLTDAFDLRSFMVPGDQVPYGACMDGALARAQFETGFQRMF